MSLHKYKVGTYSCIVFEDHPRTVSLFDRFPHVPPEEMREIAGSLDIDPQNAADSTNVLYINTGAHKVIIDTGRGYEIGHLLTLMDAEGIPPESIDTVIITHAHGDHVNGLLDAKGKRVFYNARHVIWRGEWEFWMHRDEPHEILAALGDDVDQIDTESEIVPGICPLPLPGHSPGQMGLLIQSSNKRLIHIVDALHSPIQMLYPEMSIRFDTDKILSAKTRRSVLQRAADEKLLVQTYHLPFPGLGHVEANGDGFIWKPV